MEKETWKDLEKWTDKETKQFTIKTLKTQGFNDDYIVKTLKTTIEEYMNLLKDLDK